MLAINVWSWDAGGAESVWLRTAVAPLRRSTLSVSLTLLSDAGHRGLPAAPNSAGSAHRIEAPGNCA
jgi:hypothetical protein